MFTRPDWRDKANYEWLLSDSTSLQQLAWEFLRRSPGYSGAIFQFWSADIDLATVNRQDFENYLVDSGLINDPSQLDRWRQNFAAEWGITNPAITTDDDGWLDFPMPTEDEPESFHRLDNGRLTGPRVLMPVDLSLPLEMTFARLQEKLRELRESGIRCGLVVPQGNRIQSRALYCQYLRILDAVAAGATFAQIGETLTPGATNDPESKQRDKRTRAAHTAALEMAAGGYKGLLDRDPVFLKN